ncbi:FG-GAP repeat domain-containing protein [Streptomyces sp. NPDC087440]|uniref:FG-GAP repeat domain-containing protein n=1 Tax=Streptomyces sp. NPDC087440 TaxID=3365790 RepID=UPI003815BA0D
MRNRTVHTVRLASALVAAGLTLTALAPVSYADDPAGARVLTDAQADALEKRLGDNGALSVVPQQHQQQQQRQQQPKAAPENAAPGKLALADKSALETYLGQADTTQLGGTRSDYLAVHSLGTVTRLTEDGKTVWKRDNASLYADWQVKPVRPYQKEAYPARITTGFHVVAPTSYTADRGYATGDLTGDGVADVVFTADVGTAPYRPFTSPGSTLTTGTFVTVLDGKTGHTLWSRLFADAQQVTLIGRTLLVGDQPATNMNSEKAARATLQAFRFAYADGRLTASAPWTYDTGQRDGRWGATQDLGGGLVAVSWYTRKTNTAPAANRTLVLDTADGAVRWQADGTLYARELAYDATRKRVVALEQADPRDGVRYELAAYDRTSGARVLLDSRINALGLGLRIGDLRGSSRPEYAVSEDSLDAYLYVNSSTVRALDGDRTTESDGGNELWSRTVKRSEGNLKDGESALGLKIADGRVLASYISMDRKEEAVNPSGQRFAVLSALNGRNGEADWEKTGVTASPMYAQPYRAGGRGGFGGEWRVRTVDSAQNVRSYRLGSGRQTELTPLMGALTSAVAVDVDGDHKQDVVAGGQSNGLWAFDGPSLAAGRPTVRWRATLPGAVHGEIRRADTDGDGRKDELVVAADTATVILDARSGRTLRTIDGRGRFVRSVEVADLDRDGDDEVLVPTDAVRAYDGRGRQVWTYDAHDKGTGLIFSDVSVSEGKVFGSYATKGALEQKQPVVGGMALDARTGRLAWTAAPTWTGDPDTRIRAAQLDHGVYASTQIPYADGHAVVHTYLVQEGTYLTTLIEFRDTRTGKVVHTSKGGGAWTVGNWFTGPEGLVLASTVTFQTFAGGDKEYRILTLPVLTTGGFATGPGGQRLLVGGVQGGVQVWDPAVLTAGRQYPDSLTSGTKYATEHTLIADLTGDGVDELVGLELDETGYDRTVELAGGRYLQQKDNTRGLAVFSLGAAQ